jgi:hypothetical protein
MTTGTLKLTRKMHSMERGSHVVRDATIIQAPAHAQQNVIITPVRFTPCAIGATINALSRAPAPA